MNDMGLPTLTCLLAIRKAKQRLSNLDYSIAGGLVTGRDMAKTQALGCDGIAFGKAFLIAANAGRNHFGSDTPDAAALSAAGARGVYNYAVEGVTNEARMLISSIGKYDFAAGRNIEPYQINGHALSTIDVATTDAQVADMLDLLYVYDPGLREKLGAATAILRHRNAGAMATA